jgi:hypothetical protein
MARQIDLRAHCRRRLDRLQADLEQGLDADGGIRRAGLRAAAEVEAEMYEHVQRALEQWQEDGHARGR